MATVPGSALHGRRLRDSKDGLNYMLATLGIEMDDDSDEDFVLEEDADDLEADDDADDLVAEEEDEKAIEAETEYNPKEVHNPPKQRKLRPSVLEKRKLEALFEASDEDEGDNVRAAVGSIPCLEYTPRKRASKHLKEMQSMATDRDEIENVVPPFPSDPIESWEEFDILLKNYKRKYNLKFRVRSSETTALYNRSHNVKMPEDFKWTHKVLRCTHGISQQSRSKGHRNRKVRYCGCLTRLTPTVTRVQGGAYVIVIQNENHTHSHPTSPTEAATYMTTETLPLDDEDREDVKTLADARVSSSHIANFLNDRIGCKVTPQQTRNLIRSITGHDSGEDHMKDMLHALRQLDGCDVLVLQDQMDITCGVVMQTKIQKMMFERWGETLAMDFTHGTNNLGYHLGSLIVTTSTGRGFPVVDFICLNEQAVTIATVLDYFKKKNPRWRDIHTVAIDKDFVEWRVLEECFPDATILLCQFHAISYWKKVMNRSAYRVKIHQLLSSMTGLLYSPTQSAYEAGYEAFEGYCKTNKMQVFFAYFDKNWNSCRGMWSNFARGKHFTAGNTTTNRIESNWNQLKMLLGQKTRIDKTIAGLLQHQITIAQQIVAEIGKQHSSSRVPKTVPRYLRAVATRLSSNMLEKVKKEWERYMTLMESACCEKGSTISAWKVYSSNQTFLCDDIDWECTCLFYTSNHLPCRHLMFAASKGRGFEFLPAISIDERWSIYEALKIKEDLASAADALLPIVRMSKLKLPKVRLRDDSNDDEPSASTSEPQKQVAYVRLHRHERANMVVLSSAEKYCYAKAMLEPLLQHLSDLSSAEFYQELNAWKETVEAGLNRVDSKAAYAAGTTHPDDDDDVSGEDPLTILDPADAMGTINLMNALETTSDGCSTDISTDDDNEVVPTKPVQVNLEQSYQQLPTSGETSKSVENVTDCKQDVGDESHSRLSSTTAKPVRQVDIITVPKPKSRGRARSKTKQLRQTKMTLGPDRLAIHKYPSGLSVSLDQLVGWARNTANMKYVMEMMEIYPVQLEDAYLRARTIECRWEAVPATEYTHNFVIPIDLTRSMQAAISNARQEQRKPDELDARVKKQGIVLEVVASIDPKLWKFSSQYVYSLVGFYAIKAKGRAWFADRKWLEQDWRKVKSDVALFAHETKTFGMSADSMGNRHRALANEIISKFTSSRLRTEFVTMNGGGLISFDNIVGGICRATPKEPLGNIKFVVHPVNLNASHWGIIIVRLSGKATPRAILRVHVYMYEPLIDDAYHKNMEEVWNGIPKGENDEESQGKEGLRGFIERWHKASIPSSKLRIDPIEWVERPQQPDGASCGVLVVAQAHNYLTGNEERQNYNVSASDVKVMRLRMLWVIMHLSHERSMSESDATTTSKIHQKLQDELK
ncbi:hypothetical protein PR001_g4077 [Phytophthora rubi]|uniref:SWIM-type domain-containing protein n=1 Tax=Phytophthora rubi TaxID=129364 RepID=A0A6A3NYC7_9STRA|nr:hypothetical protein PR001_g4077 [Phytophthora rubi]